jgi:UDPglucose 6-dehydrogenase
MKIGIVGLGYVGLSLSLVLSQEHEVVALDLDEKKIDKLNKRISPYNDKDENDFLKTKKLNLIATRNNIECFKDSEFVIIAVPTDYDQKTNKFNTEIVESVINDVISIERNTNIVIKSTVPFGFTENIKQKLKINNIFFSPEFLRETKALYDNLFPSRIIVGDNSPKARQFGEILNQCSVKKDIQIISMSSFEAESVKLFSNTYLALRVSFFNELDTFSEVNKLNTKKIIEGICLDPRIGNFYNNPSFGYGGYCLPKDTKQLLENYRDIPNSIISAVIEANIKRKSFIVSNILSKNINVIGVYKLAMKKDSDNFRESAVIDIMMSLISKNIKIILYEPNIQNQIFEGIVNYNNLDEFIKDSDLIIANRVEDEIGHVKEKVYSRDIFHKN